MWKDIESVGTFFLELPKMEKADILFEAVTSYFPRQRIFILTACPKTFYPEAARQKMAWFRNNFDPYQSISVLPMLGGRHKALFMQSAKDILIDDMIENVNSWRYAGGIGVHYNEQTTDIYSELVKAVQ